jgi:flagellar motor switch protein FliN
VNTDEALLKLGETTTEAVLGVLASLCAEGVERGQVTVLESGSPPLETIAYPALAADVSYTDGVTGGNVFAITRLGARRLAAAMMFAELPGEDTDEQLGEIELSAIGEAMNQMMAASAGGLSAALGYPVDISVPTTRTLAGAQDADGVYPQTPYATSVSFTVLGESCRLIQLIPNAFVVRMVRALEGGLSEPEPGSAGVSRVPRADSEDTRRAAMLWDVPVRVAAELGRATITLGQAAEPLPGEVIELDRASHDPVDICINGRRFATGELFLIDQNEWAIRIEQVLDGDPAEYVSPTGRT